MSIELHKIKNRNNLPVPYKKKPYPQFTAEDLPRNFWCGCFIGARNSGKTVQAIKLMKMMEESTLKDIDGNVIPLRHILFSPTVGANENFHVLKYLADEDIHTEYTDEKLREIMKETEEIKEDAEEYRVIKKIFNKFNRFLIKEGLNFDRESMTLPRERFSENEKDILEMYDYEMPDEPKYPYGVCTNVIYDDLIGSDAFSTKRGSPVMNSVYFGRHINMNILIISQDPMKIPKSIRINSALLVIFRYGQKKVIESIYNEVSGMMTYDTFEKLYDVITLEDHSFLCIDHTQPKENRVKKNFEYVVKFQKS